MRLAIDDWFRLYFQKEATTDEDPCQRIPYTVVNKLTKTAFGEYQATSEDEFAATILDTLDAKKAEAMQMALVGGSCLRSRHRCHWLEMECYQPGECLRVRSRR